MDAASSAWRTDQRDNCLLLQQDLPEGRHQQAGAGEAVHPVLFVPPLTGVELQAKLDNK